MTTYQPSVVVHIAFDSGYHTPDVDRTWTDVTDYVEADDAIDIGFGRGDELATTDANTLSLTLDNTDGRFTAGLVTSPYYPNVKIGRPIRVMTLPVGGTPSIRYVGYIEEWPVEWDGSEDYASTTITAVSRLARMGLDSQRRQLVPEVIGQRSPYLHYPLSEDAGVTAIADISGNARNGALSARGTAPTIGVGLVTDDESSPVFATGSKVIRYGDPSVISDDAVTISCFIKTTSVTTQSIASVYEQPLPSTNVAVASTISTNFSGELSVLLTFHNGGGVLNNSMQSTTLVNDGEVHHVMLSVDIGGTARLFIDGAQEDTASTVGLTFEPTAVSVGASANDLYATPTATFVGSLSNFAVFASALDADDAERIADAGLTGYVGDTTDVRAARYLEWEGVATAEQDLEAGVVTLVHVDTTGSSVLDLLRIIETTDDGVLYDTPDGKVALQSRTHRYGVAPAFEFDIASGRVESDYSPKLDRSTLLNTATATNLAGTVEASYTDTVSVDEYGVSDTSLTTASDDDGEPAAMASWRVSRYAEPRVRVPSLTIDLLPFEASDQDQILALTLGDLITVKNHPSQAAESSSDYFIEGYTENITGTTYGITFNLSPGWPFNSLFTIGDATLGAIGGPGVLAH